MELIKQDKRGKTYRTIEGFEILYRFAGTVSGDNEINPEEKIYLIAGRAKITLEDNIWEVTAPVKMEFPEKTYHKIEAITDISFILFNN